MDVTSNQMMCFMTQNFVSII